MATARKSPDLLPDFELTPESLLAEVDSILASTTHLQNVLAQIDPSAATFANLVVPLIDDANRAACRLRILGSVIVSVSPDPTLREASRQAETKIAAADAETLLRQDIAIRIAAVFERSHADSALDAQDRYLLSYLHGQYRRSGATLVDETRRSRLRDALAELSASRIAAQKAFTEVKDGIVLSRTELIGVPKEVLSSMRKFEDKTQNSDGEDLFYVTYGNNHVTNVMRHASNEHTRRKLYVSKQHRFPENVPRLKRMIVLRDEIARLLGYDSYASMRMEDMMAQSVGQVTSFLEELKTAIRPLAQVELEMLLESKQKDVGSALNGTASAKDEEHSKLYIWDLAFYSSKLRKERYSVDHSAVAEYFEARHTLHGMLKIFEDLFGMEFEQITAQAWHKDVNVYSVWDSADQGGSFLGHLYVDLFERGGKYRGAHHLLIRPGFTEANGALHYPASALVCSFAVPSVDKRTLLRHDEVRTMFHELGHAIHNIVSRTKYAIPLARDFIEVPSIMLESWVWNPDVLVALGKHYTSLEETEADVLEGGDRAEALVVLPRKLAEAIASTKMLFKARGALAQVQPAIFDLEVHTPGDHEAAENIDPTEIWNRTKRDVLVEDCGRQSDQGPGQSQFPHIYRKYDAAYFAYPLSMIYAADLFTTGFLKDPLSKAEGRRYRRAILEVGASQSEEKSIENYLGRPCNSRAFLDGLSVTQ